MGELATYSAILSKTGLGKEGTECPPKSVILALTNGLNPPDTTLRITNATTYGNTEGVKLEDIIKVSYEYYLGWNDIKNDSIDVIALPSTLDGFVDSTRNELNNDVRVTTTNVGYTITTSTSWIKVVGNSIQFEENLDLNPRNGMVTVTQNESGISKNLYIIQDQADFNWVYTFSASLNNTTNVGPTGGNRSLEITSSKQEYRNGHTYGGTVEVGTTSSVNGNWLTISGSIISVTENQSTSSRSSIITVRQLESSNTKSITLNQDAGYRSYGDLSVTYNIPELVIPASGGSINLNSVVDFDSSQTWGWNGNTSNGGTITGTNTSLNWDWDVASVAANSKGTTLSSKNIIVQRRLTVTGNGNKTSYYDAVVYQAANEVTSTTEGTPVISISASPTTIPNTGGTSRILSTALASVTHHYSSGASKANASLVEYSPTISIPSDAGGFTLALDSGSTSNGTLTAAENVGNNRSVVVTSSYPGATSQSVTVTQAEGSIGVTTEYFRYILTSSDGSVNKTIDLSSRPSDYSPGSDVNETIHINPNTAWVKVQAKFKFNFHRNGVVYKVVSDDGSTGSDASFLVRNYINHDEVIETYTSEYPTGSECPIWTIGVSENMDAERSFRTTFEKLGFWNQSVYYIRFVQEAYVWTYVFNFT